jgi:hypothetical protein
MELLEATQLIPGMTAKPLSTGLVLLSVHYSADPIGWTQDRIDTVRRRLGGIGSWRVKKEMEMDANAQSGENVFDPGWLDLQQAKHLRAPLMRMDVSTEGKVYEKSDGRLRIWIPPDRLPADLPHGANSARLTFGMGMDVGAGTNQSDSTIVGFAVQGMEQAFEFNSAGVAPAYLGRMAVAIARYYNDALICCVQKLHGITTIRSMLDLGYTNLWRNVQHDRMVETANGGRIGWVKGESNDALLMDNVGDALQGSAGLDVMSAHGVVVHSVQLLEQLRQYVYDESGRAVLSKNKILNTAARKQHGDLVVGTALGIRACMDQPPYRVLSMKQIPDGCAEARHLERELRKVDTARW